MPGGVEHLPRGTLGSVVGSIVGTIVGNVVLLACAVCAVSLVERMGRRDLLRTSCAVLAAPTCVGGARRGVRATRPGAWGGPDAAALAGCLRRPLYQHKGEPRMLKGASGPGRALPPNSQAAYL